MSNERTCIKKLLKCTTLDRAFGYFFQMKKIFMIEKKSYSEDVSEKSPCIFLITIFLSYNS